MDAQATKTDAQHGLTRRIADYAVAAAATPLLETVQEKAKHHVLDTIAAMVSGSTLEPGRAARDYVQSLGGREDATVIGAPFRTNTVNAALANAMSAHADETDDSHPASITHPGCAVVPAALATAEREGASGSAFLRAVVLGYDLCARTGMMLGGERFLAEKGFDTHAFGGAIGAAGAAAALAIRDPVRISHALSYAAQQAAGLATLFRDRDHIEKAFVFAGLPARNGVASATMVASGMTGVTDVFDGNPSFLSAFGVVSKGIDLFDDLGTQFEITRTNIKRWSVGSPAQAVLDSLEALVSQHGVKARDVASIEVHLPERGAHVVNNRNMPSVNVQHLVALMLVDGTVGFISSHDAARMEDPNVLVMRRKVMLVPSAELSRAKPARQAIVELTLEDGRRLRHHTRAVRGTTTNPMTREEVTTKALDLIAPVLGHERASGVIAIVFELNQAASLTPLATLLQGGGAAD
jgi:2-methylcitrate dehydratase PrpD